MIASLQNSVASLQGLVASLQSTASQQQATISTLNNTVTALQTLTSSQGAYIATLQGLTASQGSSISSLQTTATTHSANISTFSNFMNAPTIPNLGTATCSAGNYGGLRINATTVLVCASTNSWTPLNPTFGLSLVNPALSCAQVTLYLGASNVNGLYWITQSNGQVIQQACTGVNNYGGNGSSSVASSTSCSALQTYFGITTSANYFINGASTPCFYSTYSSCQAAMNLIPGLPNGVYNLTIAGTVIPTYCYSYNGLFWALVMKTDGTKSTFGYTSTYWTSQNGFNLANYAGGLDNNEYQSTL